MDHKELAQSNNTLFLLDLNSLGAVKPRMRQKGQVGFITLILDTWVDFPDAGKWPLLGMFQEGVWQPWVWQYLGKVMFMVQNLEGTWFFKLFFIKDFDKQNSYNTLKKVFL